MVRFVVGLVSVVGILFGAIHAASAADPIIPKASVRQAPQRLHPAEHGIGRLIPPLIGADIQGKSWRLNNPDHGLAIVIAMTSTSCPLSQRYGPTLAALEKEYRDRGVVFRFINPIATDAMDDMKRMAAAFGGIPYVPDPRGTLAKILEARTTTEVFVLDGGCTLNYRGAIDDQYGLGYTLDSPRRHYLRDALDAVLAGRKPTVEATEAPGCALDFEKVEASPVAVNYHNRISRIVQSHCLECHRRDGVALFALERYEEVSAHKGMIRKVVERGVMPPWFAAPPAQGKNNPWLNDHSLAAAEKSDLLAWLTAGLPEGNAADAPLPRRFPDQWQIGTPDAVIQLPKPIAIKADGVVPYQYATAATSFDEDKWVQALEIQPTNRAVVHHVLVFVQPKGPTTPMARAESSDEGRGFFAIYVPGNSAMTYPDGFAKRLPKGASLRFQIHYTPNGTATQDQTKLGLIFAKKPPQHEVQVAGILNPRIQIPPGAADHVEKAAQPVPFDVKVTALLPHMHVRGKAFRYEVERPDGTTELLLDIPRYDFNWQLAYRLAEPLDLPRGTTIRLTGWFDNSSANPANPDPTKTVRWGPQTYDEMMLGYVEFYRTSTPAASTQKIKD